MIDFYLDKPMTWIDNLARFVDLDPTNWHRLLNEYTQPTRGYHGLFHIAFLWHCHCTLWPELPEDDVLRNYRRHHRWIANAVACHDVVYNSKSKANELDSAIWWRAAVSESWALPAYDLDKKTTYHGPDPYDIHWTAMAIEASADHLADRPMDTDDEKLLQWFIGLDLIPLAAPYELFDRNQMLIRAEYSHLTSAEWDAGRKAFLTKVDRHPVIYRHLELYKLFEADARANVKRALIEIG